MNANWSKAQSSVPPTQYCYNTTRILLPEDITITSQNDNVYIDDEGYVHISPGTYDFSFGSSKVNGAGSVLFNVLIGGIAMKNYPNNMTYTNVATSHGGSGYSGVCYADSLYWTGKVYNITIGSNGGTVRYIISDLYQVPVSTFIGHLSISEH